MIAQRRATAQAPAAPATESSVQPADQVAEHDTTTPAQRLAGPEAAAPPEDPATAGVHNPGTERTNVLSLSADTGTADTGTAAAPPAPVQRLSEPPTSAPPAVPVQRLSRPPATASPKFAALKSDVKGKQNTLAAHPPPASKANAAQAAAKPPADDKQAQGKAANAEKMNAAQPGAFDKAAFIAAVNKAIADQAPKNLDEADTFGDSGKADAVKGQVQGQVGQGKEQSAKQIETTTKAAPDTSAAKEKPVTPLAKDPPPANPGAPNPDNAVPDKAPAAATDFSAGPAQVNQEMAGAQVTEEQLAKSNEPEFTGALKEKKAGEQHAATAPGQVRAAENQTLSDAKADAKGTAAGSVEAMRGQKAAANNAVGQGQQGAQGKDESKRAQVTAKLQTVFDATQKDVESILTGLDKKVDDAFSSGEKQARDSFTAEHKRKMDEYKDKRYSGFTGKLKWVKDKFAGLPDEANQIFVTARQGYVTKMQGVISNVADVIGGELNRAKQRIATGRQQLQAEVQKLPADLQAVGKEAAGEFSGKFDELTESVDAKGKELVQTLATKYNEALKSVDAEIEAEKEKNKGLIAKAVDAVKGVIDTILKLKDLLLGVLAKAAQAVMAILKDPIGFLGNLVSAVGAGLKAFMNNIGSHLKKGLIGWLLGSMANAGIQLPDKFDLRGILSMIASLLGLTWGAIRGRIVQKGVPEQAMTAVEAGVPIVAKLQSGGVAGAYEEIKDQVGDLKENLLGKISQYLIPTVLIAGITWIISLLNPASAFIKACKMIIDIVTFIIDRGAQIIEFVNAVLDAVIAIAGGGAGGVPALIEGALAKSIPVLIGALAAILGIGGIATKVKSFFQALSKPVMKAVDWIVGKIVKLGKAIWAKLKAKAKGKGKDGKTGPDGKADPAAIRAGVVQDLRTRAPDGTEASKVRAAATAVYGIWQPRGLKKLEVIHRTSGKPGYDVYVTASPRTKVYDVDVNLEADPRTGQGHFDETQPFRIPQDVQLDQNIATRAQGSLSWPQDLGKLRVVRSARQYSGSWYYAEHDDGTKFMSRRELDRALKAKGTPTDSKGLGQHAEVVVMEALKGHLPEAEQFKQTFDYSPLCWLQMNVTRSPCPSCAPAIIRYRDEAKARNWDMKVRVSAVSLWHTSPTDSAAGEAAVHQLQAAGITVTVHQFTKEQTEKLAAEDPKLAALLAARADELIDVILGG
ncbi:hypothetical protein [Actinoplanes sp. NPDC089786]|uniref:hypothetical protein n=1 Tax=Actinoplanes sp. NPDC089786 TaxID=3155185 RepID=UPI003419B0C9